MVIVAPAMQQVYELLAFVVALYFPVALMTWLVIDKLFVSGGGKARPVRRRSEGCGPNRILADHPQREI
jgi:hypothetical protein